MTDLRVAIDARGARPGADEFKRAVKSMERAAQSLEKAIAHSEKTTERFEKRQKSSSRANDVAVRSIRRLIAAYAGFATVRAAVRGMVNYEQQLVAVGKTSDLSGKQLRDLGRDIQSVAAVTPLTIKGLLETAAAAGQLGVTGPRNIVEFATVMEQLARTSDIVGSEGAKQVARLLGVTRDGVGVVGQFGDVVTSLGNNSAATEAEILRMALEIAKATAIFEVSSAEALAFAAATAESGVQAELAATSYGKSFRAIESAVRSGGSELQSLQAITRQSGDEIRRQFEESPAESFRAFLRGLREIKSEGGDVTGALAAMGLRSERLLKTLPVLALNADRMSDKFALMEEQLRKGGARTKEFEASANTLGGELTKLTNVWDIWVAKMSEGNSILSQIARSVRIAARDLAGIEPPEFRPKPVGVAAESVSEQLEAIRLLRQRSAKLSPFRFLDGRSERVGAGRAELEERFRAAIPGVDPKTFFDQFEGAGGAGLFQIPDAAVQPIADAIERALIVRGPGADIFGAVNRAVAGGTSTEVAPQSSEPSAGSSPAREQARTDINADLLETLRLMRLERDLGAEIAAQEAARADAVNRSLEAGLSLDAAEAQGRAAADTVAQMQRVTREIDNQKQAQEQFRQLEREAAAEREAAIQRQMHLQRQSINQQQSFLDLGVRGAVQIARAGDNWKDALRGVGDQMADLLLSMFLEEIRQQRLLALEQQRLAVAAQRASISVVGGFASALGGGGGGNSVATARGNIFWNGEVQQFARGGLPEFIHRPTARISPSGTLQTFGENVRPDPFEVVLPGFRSPSGTPSVRQAGGGTAPLQRMPNGELGVGGGGSAVVHVTVQQTIHFSGNPSGRERDAFKRSAKQARRAMLDAMRGTA